MTDPKTNPKTNPKTDPKANPAAGPITTPITTPNVIRIARATPNDRPAIMALARADHAESIFGDLVFSERKFSTLFDKSIDQPNSCLTLLAAIGGEIVGFLYCTLGQYFIAEDGVIANVNVVYVDQRLRQSLLGGKVALRLVRGVSKWARAQGAYLVMFYVTSGTAIAKTDRFFRKLGMTSLGGNYAMRL